MSQENQNIQEEPHKRRVRYKGKYPRNYKEKYKEQIGRASCRERV